MGALWQATKMIGRGTLAACRLGKKLVDGDDVTMSDVGAVIPIFSRHPLLKASDDTRCDHTLLMGAPGCGKSSLLQEMWCKDLPRLRKRQMSIVVIDSSDLIDDMIAHSALHALDNVILIDPADPDSMPRLNLFACSIEGNQTIKTVNFVNTFIAVCSGLLEAEMSSLMKSFFRFSGQLLLCKSDTPTLDMFLRLLRDTEAFLGEVREDAPRKAVEFFEQEIIGGKKNSSPFFRTVGDVAGRVYHILSDPIMTRLLVNENPTVDLAQAINSGSIILVATRKGEIGDEGARLLGKFVLSMLRRAAMERRPIPRDQRLFTVGMVDEYQNYLTKGKDPELCALLDQDARKNRVAMVLANQRLGQISAEMGDTVLTSTGTKVIGRQSNIVAARTIAPALGLKPEDLTGLKKLKFKVSVTKPDSKKSDADIVDLDATPGAIKKAGKRDPRAIHKLREVMASRFAGLEPDESEGTSDVPVFEGI